MNLNEQLERQISERRSGELTAAQLAEIERAIAADPVVAAAARQYERLDRLLGCWRKLPDHVDWEAFARQTAARVSAEAADEGVDGLLERWAGPMPEVNWGALKSRISGAVAEEAAGAHRQAATAASRWRRAANWARVAVPLAAAAAIALLVWWPGSASVPRGPGAAGRPIILVSLDAPGESGKVTVTFEGGEAPAGAAEPEWVTSGGIKYVGPAEAETAPSSGGSVAIAVGLSSGDLVEPVESDDSAAEGLLY